jgi:limonene 1,2-monooxygenase
METDGFTIRDARLQLRPYSQPHFQVAIAASISPTGAVAAGTHGVGLLSIAATSKQGFDALGTHWQTWSEVAERHGHVADRSRWRLVGPMHLAETRELAREQVAYGIVEFSSYFTHVLPAGPVRGNSAEEIIANVDDDGFAVIGTPDDAIRKIQSLIDESGGFGTFLLFGHDWANPEHTKHSFELFAKHVIPHFTGQLDAPRASCEWVTGSGGEFVNRAANAIMKAIGDYADQRSPTPPS